jgi:hypothetical protein
MEISRCGWYVKEPILKMEAEALSEMCVHIYLTQYNIPEDTHLQSHLHGNFTSLISHFSFGIL